jgi:hypothetical protein
MPGFIRRRGVLLWRRAVRLPDDGPRPAPVPLTHDARLHHPGTVPNESRAAAVCNIQTQTLRDMPGATGEGAVRCVTRWAGEISSGGADGQEGSCSMQDGALGVRGERSRLRRGSAELRQSQPGREPATHTQLQLLGASGGEAEVAWRTC